jgi:hypothetical protein
MPSESLPTQPLRTPRLVDVMTPAMEAAISDRAWPIDEIAALLG